MAQERFMTCGQDLGPCSTSFNAGRQEHIQPARGTLLLLHSPKGQSETPEKLCKCKITNPLRIGRGQGKKEQSVRRQEPAAGGVAAVVFVISRAITTQVWSPDWPRARGYTGEEGQRSRLAQDPPAGP